MNYKPGDIFICIKEAKHMIYRKKDIIIITSIKNDISFNHDYLRYNKKDNPRYNRDKHMKDVFYIFHDKLEEYFVKLPTKLAGVLYS